jgi:glyoxylase-like metal-dependent hydrolase (beta-lactamase superfamily II)
MAQAKEEKNKAIVLQAFETLFKKRDYAKVLMAALIGGATLALAPLEVAHAAAPVAKTSAPGFYRMMLGDFEVTALSDGTAEFPVDKLLTGTTPAKVNQALAKSFLKSPLETSGSGYLINTGTKLILIDAGSGRIFGPTLGYLVTNMRAAGYQPEQVDEIYITHMHADHVGGLMDGDKMVFPNAIVRADEHDADFWLDQANLEKAPDAAKEFFKGAMASLNPYVKANRFSPFDGETELSPGIKAVPTRGHTPGHSTYVVESKGQKLVVWGDLIHVASVQFDNPSIGIQFDGDSKAAAVQRKHAFADAAKGGYIVAASHIQFPGLGRVRTNGKAFTWIPVNYSVVR